jgi:hypothetical protein
MSELIDIGYVSVRTVGNLFSYEITDDGRAALQAIRRRVMRPREGRPSAAINSAATGRIAALRASPISGKHWPRRARAAIIIEAFVERHVGLAIDVAVGARQRPRIAGDCRWRRRRGTLGVGVTAKQKRGHQGRGCLRSTASNIKFYGLGFGAKVADTGISAASGNRIRQPDRLRFCRRRTGQRV